MDNALQIKNLSKSYDGFKLDDISLALGKGYVLGFIGHNGAGKTTTIKLIMNLIKRDAGEVQVFGWDNIKDELLVKQNIGFVYEDCYYYEELTGREVARIVGPLYLHWDQATISRNLPCLRGRGLKPSPGVCA